MDNYGFQIKDKEEFVKKLTEGISKPPSYFFVDAGKNQEGPGSHEEEFKKASHPLTIEEFQKVSETAKIIDTRVNV